MTYCVTPAAFSFGAVMIGEYLLHPFEMGGSAFMEVTATEPMELRDHQVLARFCDAPEQNGLWSVRDVWFRNAQRGWTHQPEQRLKVGQRAILLVVR